MSLADALVGPGTTATATDPGRRQGEPAWPHRHRLGRRVRGGGRIGDTVAAVALGVAASQSVTPVFVVFGVWAALAGVALRRRAQLGRQWPMLAAGGVLVLFGAAFIIAAATGHTMLAMVVVYAATGGADFVIQALLLVRRRRLAAATDPTHSAR